MTKLVISLATRGRPDLLVRTIMRTVPNVARPNTVLMVQVDSDDLATIQALDKASLPVFVKVCIKDREDTVADKFGRALSEAADVYVTMADEHPLITPGFDEKFIEGAEIFPDRIGWMYGHCANASFPATAGVTARFVEKIGFLYPNYFPYWFVDHWVDDIVRICQRISYVEVLTDQSGSGGVPQEMREAAWWAAFFDAGYLMRRKQAHDLINDPEFDAPAWQKRQMLRHHPLIEFRSRWINDGVRANAAGWERVGGQDVKNERYQRKKAEAIRMIPHLLDDYGMAAAEATMFRNYLTPPTQIININRAYA